MFGITADFTTSIEHLVNDEGINQHVPILLEILNFLIIYEYTIVFQRDETPWTYNYKLESHNKVILSCTLFRARENSFRGYNKRQL